MEMDHFERRRWCEEISKINGKLKNDGEGTPKSLDRL